MRRVFRLVFLAGIAVLFPLSLSGALPRALDPGVQDKLAHFGAYFALAFSGAMGWPRWRGAFLLALPLLGVAIEAAQGQVPGRSLDWKDALSNAAGVGVAVAIAARITRAPKSR